ncbi:hypothetical protein [Sphingomonas koreensis]|jgi:hypothetical protein|nr:hypothetical protein [Sphingomonas koreensis]
MGDGMRFAATALILFASVLGSSPAYAEGWTGDLTIHMAFTEDSDLLVVSTTDGNQYATGCGVNQWIVHAATEERRSRAWATILTAIGTGKKIRFWFKDTCSNWSYHSASAVMIVQ